jgi:DNA-binding protein Fis
MGSAKKNKEIEMRVGDGSASPKDVAGTILENNLEDITSLIYSADGSKSRLYDDVVEMVDRALVRIAMRRTNRIKSAAASYLGINRSTLQNKIAKLEKGGELE